MAKPLDATAVSSPEPVVANFTEVAKIQQTMKLKNQVQFLTKSERPSIPVNKVYKVAGLNMSSGMDSPRISYAKPKAFILTGENVQAWYQQRLAWIYYCAIKGGNEVKTGDRCGYQWVMAKHPELPNTYMINPTQHWVDILQNVMLRNTELTLEILERCLHDPRDLLGYEDAFNKQSPQVCDWRYTPRGITFTSAKIRCVEHFVACVHMVATVLDKAAGQDLDLKEKGDWTYVFYLLIMLTMSPKDKMELFKNYLNFDTSEQDSVFLRKMQAQPIRAGKILPQRNTDKEADFTRLESEQRSSLAANSQFFATNITMINTKLDFYYDVYFQPPITMTADMVVVREIYMQKNRCQADFCFPYRAAKCIPRYIFKERDVVGLESFLHKNRRQQLQEKKQCASNQAMTTTTNSGTTITTTTMSAKEEEEETDMVDGYLGWTCYLVNDCHGEVLYVNPNEAFDIFLVRAFRGWMSNISRNLFMHYITDDSNIPECLKLAFAYVGNMSCRLAPTHACRFPQQNITTAQAFVAWFAVACQVVYAAYASKGSTIPPVGVDTTAAAMALIFKHKLSYRKQNKVREACKQATFKNARSREQFMAAQQMGFVMQEDRGDSEPELLVTNKNASEDDDESIKQNREEERRQQKRSEIAKRVVAKREEEKKHHEPTITVVMRKRQSTKEKNDKRHDCDVRHGSRREDNMARLPYRRSEKKDEKQHIHHSLDHRYHHNERKRRRNDRERHHRRIHINERRGRRREEMHNKNRWSFSPLPQHTTTTRSSSSREENKTSPSPPQSPCTSTTSICLRLSSSLEESQPMDKRLTSPTMSVAAVDDVLPCPRAITPPAPSSSVPATPAITPLDGEADESNTINKVCIMTVKDPKPCLEPSPAIPTIPFHPHTTTTTTTTLIPSLPKSAKPPGLLPGAADSEEELDYEEDIEEHAPMPPPPPPSPPAVVPVSTVVLTPVNLPQQQLPKTLVGAGPLPASVLLLDHPTLPLAQEKSHAVNDTALATAASEDDCILLLDDATATEENDDDPEEFVRTLLYE